MVMPRMDGLELLKALKDEAEHLKIIVLTAQGSVETAVEAVKDGAEDYLTKPVDPQKLRLLLAAHRRAERRRSARTKSCAASCARRAASAASSATARRCGRIYQVIEQAAPTTASVLIIGESGTGKELVAQTIHQLSPRAEAPFVAINCAAIPETLLESEIFGHERGAFTGAIDRRAGCFELADRGTLFLDEIAEMVPVTQVKLLRVLQERKFRRLGGRVEQEVDVRVHRRDQRRSARRRSATASSATICTTGSNVFTIELPPLRDRKDDLPLLIQAFLDEFNTRDRRQVRGGRRPRRCGMLELYDWPGNVRELRNVIERATILARGEFIEPQHLPRFGARRRAPAEPQPARRDHHARA